MKFKVNVNEIVSLSVPDGDFEPDKSESDDEETIEKEEKELSQDEVRVI